MIINQKEAKDIKKTCDNCDAQEGRHYCLLHSKQVKNMDITVCEDWRMRKEVENMKQVILLNILSRAYLNKINDLSFNDR